VRRCAVENEQEMTAMSLAALQSVLTRLYTDPAFRAALRRDERLLDEYPLGARERAAAAELAAMRQVDAFVEDLYEKSFGQAWGQFPTVRRYFSAAGPEAFRLYRERHDFVDRGWLGDAEHFATVLRACAVQGRVGLPACYLDAVRYDLAVLRAAAVPGAPAGPAFSGDVARFTTGPGVELVRLDHDIPALFRGTPPGALVRRQCTLAVVPSRDAAGVVLALTPTLERLVERARPGATAAELVAAAGGGAPETPAFRAACRRAIQELVERGVLVPATPRSSLPVRESFDSASR
jgi:hypothetical protein